MIKHIRTTLWCLHGNLQPPDVWKTVFTGNWPVQIKTPDLYASHAASIDQWAEEFILDVKGGPDSNHVLLGYSLGGRLALHALAKAPSLWHAAVIISATPGIADAEARQRAYANDNHWADRFLDEPMDELLKEWDRLPVFCGRQNNCPRGHLQGEAVARIFRNFSKGSQADLMPILRNRELPPVLLITGSDDQKYTAIASEMASSIPSATHETVKNAGHRVPWEAPEAFIGVITSFLKEVTFDR